jgi:amino acid adenylation domain-containing protein
MERGVMSAEAQSVVLFDRKLQEERQYWLRRLEGALELSDAWLDFDRPRSWSKPEESLEAAFPADLATRLDKLTGGSPFLTYAAILAGLFACLERYTGGATLVVGSPALLELERPNALPIVGRLPGRQSFKELLLAVRASLLEAYDRQRYPHSYLLRDLDGLADVPCPLFDAAVSLAGLHGPWPPIEPCLVLDLSRDDGGGIAGRLRFRPEVFRRERMEAFLRHLAQLLAGALERPEAPLEELDPLSPAERQQIVAGFNRTATAYPADATLPALFDAQAAATPDAPAVLFEDEELSYRELARRANRLAHHLRALGVGPEVVVGVFLERSAEMVVALLAIVKAGGAYLPLDPEYPAERLSRLLGTSRVPVVVTAGTLAAKLPPSGARQVLAEDFSAPGSPGDERPPAVPLDPDNLAYVIHTSGSTGQPQGAMNTHRAICNRLFWMQQAYRLEPGERVVQKTPFGFDVSVWEFFWPLMTGACIVVALPGGHRDTAYLHRLFAERRIRVTHFVPSMLQVFLEEDGLAELTDLRLVVSSGEALSWELAERCLGELPGALHNLYGPTEAAVDVTAWDCRQPRVGRSVPIGQPIANLRIHLLSRECQPVPVGAPGELHIGGVGLARGYLARPELTADRFVPDPIAAEPGDRLYRTGDLARYLADGAIEFLGRLDHQVKIRGFRIELGEVEAVLGRHAAIREAVVLARPDGAGQLRLVAYVVPARRAAAPEERAAEAETSELLTPESGRENAAGGAGREAEAALIDEVRAALQETLPDAMIPSAFVLLDALPLLTNGKVDRKALPAPEGLGNRGRPYVAPRTPVEEKLAALWGELLRIEKVGVDDSFFDLGGHSLLLTQLASRIRKIFQVELPLRALFDLPTIADMARAILARQVESTAAVDVAAMIARLQDLSPGEVEALLRSEEL